MRAAGRYVPLAAIRQAVAGRQGEVLDRLGIDWRGGGHIRCPYPDHDDKHPSWRWDERARKAYCTCMQPKAASILSPIAFEAAVRVRTEVNIGDPEPGTKATVTPVGKPVAVEAAGETKPLIEVEVIVMVPCWPN